MGTSGPNILEFSNSIGLMKSV